MFFRTAALVIGLAGLAGCVKRGGAPPAGIELIALLPGENLSGDASLDAWAAAFPVLVNAQLQGIAGARGILLPNASDAIASRSARVVYPSIERGAGGLTLRATIEDAATHKMSAWSESAPAEAQLPAAIEKLGKRLRAGARAVPTRSAAAIHFYGTGLRTQDASAATAGFNEAVKADPAFGLAWLSWAEKWLQAGDRAKISQLVELALREGAAMPALEKQRLLLLRADLESDAAARLKALAELAALEPANLETQARAAQEATTARQFPTAVAILQRATAAAPSTSQLWNLLGYAQAYAGNDSASKEALTWYLQLEPASANPLDSMGELSLRAGRFAEAAERFEAAFVKDPAFLAGQTLRKAALARLYAGDLEGARKTMERYFGALPEGLKPALPLLRGQWEYIGGQAQSGVARLEAIARGEGGVPPLAAAQLALWSLEKGDRKSAADWVARARGKNPGRDAAAILNIVVFASLPAASAGEWRKRADAISFKTPQFDPVRDTAVALALTLQKDWPAAAAGWEMIRRAADPSAEGRAREMELFCRIQSGAKPDPKELTIWPIPGADPLDLLSFLTHPRLLYSRAMAAPATDEARRLMEMYLKLSAGRGDAFGEQAKARELSRL